ncbi:DUF6412 domain-containing protein [Streptomyces sp. C10-9-1]|uniref:DUF6412 domain-containing protein n=1 Tax=Streptomyces sp. C10-9-1 TaxID=1859285 RepID=UPI0021117BE2|nr:DUF6412 domain-containing protein [Streptomyces sp. C10-9-1]MCQ6553058.1 DUF6412 domain-containing protein [Streptomyces sp. C10-9-1]
MLRGVPRPIRLPGLLLLLLFAGAHLVDGDGMTAALALAATATAAAGSALVVCVALGARCVPAVPRTRVRTALRDRARRTAFLPQRDPDSRGRTRPRAPGRPVLTAA